jgi:starvation-inducible DNA-binding protein
MCGSTSSFTLEEKLMKKNASSSALANKSLFNNKQAKLIHLLATPTHLGERAREAITKAINPLVADAFALYVKTKNFHWHLSGPHFRDYHLLFDEQADQIFAMIDVLAERVRKLGGLTIHSIGEIQQLQNVKDDNDPFVDPIEMVRRLVDDNKNYAARMFEAHEICAEHQDVATTSVLEVFIDETERRAWFLFEIQAEEKHASQHS